MKYSESLKKNKDFQYIYRKGKSYANKYLVMYVLENGTSQNRLGISGRRLKDKTKTQEYLQKDLAISIMKNN